MKRFMVCVEEDAGFNKHWKPIKRTDNEVTAHKFMELMRTEYDRMALFDNGELRKVVEKEC